MDEGGAKELSLKRKTGGERFPHAGVGGWLRRRIGQLMNLGIEGLAGVHNKRHQAHTPRDIAASGLKVAKLLDQIRLAGLSGGQVQRIDVVEEAHDDLQPIAF